MLSLSFILRFRHVTVMSLALILAVASWTGCAGTQVNLQNEDRKLSRYKDYREPDAALLYLVYLDEDYVIGTNRVYENHKARYGETPLTESKQDRNEFYRRLSEIEAEYRRLPNSSATLFVDNQGGLKYKWPRRDWVRTPVSLSPGEHAFQIQSHYYPGRSIAPTYQDTQSYQTRHTSVLTFDHSFKSREAYALIAFRTRDGLFRCKIKELGKLGEAKKFKASAEDAADGQIKDIDASKMSATLLKKITAHLNAMSRKANSDKPYF